MSDSQAETPEVVDPLLGQLVAGRYRILERIAAGGMGVVYRATQEPLQRAVAVKVLRRPDDPRLDASYAERFLREAAVVGNLQHPNTVTIFDYGNDGANLYFAMEHLDGQTLTQRVFERGPMASLDVVHVGRQIAQSLGDAHEMGLVHRDLKPGNVMICPRRHDPLFAKVLDFGLVKLVSDEQAKKLTQSGIMMGSPRYMSPEQVRGVETIDHRADIYSFGALMTFCLTGRPPFPDGSQFEAMRHHVYTAPPALRTLDPRCAASGELEAIVLRCLAKDRAERFQTMGEVLMSLARCPEAVDASVASGPASFEQPDRTSVDLIPAGASAPPAPGTESQISQISSSWFRKADGTSLDAGGWLVRGLVAATIILAGAAAAFFVPSSESRVPSRDGSPTAALPAIPEPPATPEASSEEAPSEPVTAAGASEGTLERETFVQPVRIVTDPSGAEVVYDGATLGTTPVDLEVVAGEVWLLEVRREGYQGERLRVDGTQDLIRIELHPERSAPPAARRGDAVVGRDPARAPATMTEATMTEATRAQEPTKVIRDPWQ